MNRDAVKLYATNGSVFALTFPNYTATQVEQFLKCAVLLATLIYTLIKCWKLARQKGGNDTIQFRKEDDL